MNKEEGFIVKMLIKRIFSLLVLVLISLYLPDATKTGYFFGS
jgi:hypothetical protein